VLQPELRWCVHLGCPKCGAPMERRSGPHGVFYGCSNFGSVDLIEQCAGTLPRCLKPVVTERGRCLT